MSVYARLNANNRMIFNTLIMNIRLLLNIIISLFSSRLLIDVLGIEDFGLFTLIAGLSVMLEFISGTFSAATMRFTTVSLGSVDLVEFKKNFSASLLIYNRLSLYLIVPLEIIGVILINTVLNIPTDRLFAANVLYQLMIVNTIFTLLTIPYTSLLNSKENFLIPSILSIIGLIVKLCLIISLYYYAYDRLIVYGIGIIVLSFATRGITKYYCIKLYPEIKYDYRNYQDKTVLKSIFSFTGWSLWGGLAMTIIRQGLDFLVNIFYGVRLNAAMGISKQVNGPIYAFAQSATQSISPQIYKAFGANDQNRLNQLSFLSSKISFLLFGLLSLPILIETNYILSIWLKKVPDYASVFVQLIIISTLIRQLSVGIMTAIAATGDIKKFQFYEGMIIILTFPISWIFLKNGAEAWVTYLTLVIAETLSTITRVYFANKTAKINYWNYLKEVLIPCVCTFLTSLAITYFISYNIETSFYKFIIVTLFSLSFFLFFTFVFILNHNEKKNIVVIIQRTKSKIIK